MIRIFQSRVDVNNGDCMQAVIASLLHKNLEEVPKFIEQGDKWFSVFYSYLKDNGYEYNGTRHNIKFNMLSDNPTHDCFKDVKYHKPSIMYRSCLKNDVGIGGYFFASVLSPTYTEYNNYKHTHAVVIDKNFKIVHDPNPRYNTPEFKGYPLRKLIGFNGIIDVYNIDKL
jgi:hypothetical protein